MQASSIIASHNEGELVLKVVTRWLMAFPSNGENLKAAAPVIDALRVALATF